MELIIRSRSFLLSVLNCFIQILPSVACCARLPVGAAARRWAGRDCVAASARYGWRCGELLGPLRLALRRAPAAVGRGFEPRRCSWRGAELGAAPDVAMPGPRSGFHPQTADKRCFVAVRLRCRNGGAQAPINVISTPTCGVLIRILVCARGMSRKEAFARQFVTGLLLAGCRRAQRSC